MYYLIFLQNIRNVLGDSFTTLALAVTELAQSPLTYLVLAGIYWCIDKETGEVMGIHTSLACTYSAFIKWKCKIERPWVRDHRVKPVQAALATANDYSFPSGHTARAMATYGSVGAMALKKEKKLLGKMSFVLVALIMFSRNFLGVHTLWDVLFAAGLGIVYLFIAMFILNWAAASDTEDEKTFNIKRLIVALAGIIVCFLPMVFMGCNSNAGFGMGFFFGWYVEHRFINFDVKRGDPTERVVRFLIGGAGIYVVYYAANSALKIVIPSKYVGFFTQLLLALFITVVYPFFFAKKERFKRGIILAVIGCLLIGSLSALAVSRKSDGFRSILTSFEPSGNYPLSSDYDVPETKVIAHRGYSSVYPENTMKAFEAAVELGCDYIELDVQRTKDGKIVVFHDNDLSRIITGNKLEIADYTLEQLRKKDFGVWFDSEYKGTQINTLEEVLEYVATTDDCKVYLELKDLTRYNTTEEYSIENIDPFVQQVYDIAKKTGTLDRCVFASFQYEYLREIKAIDVEAPVLLNTSTADPSLPREYVADYYGIAMGELNKDCVDEIHKAGKQAFVWNADTPEQIEFALSCEVDGICSNYPDLVMILIHPEYEYLSKHYINSWVLPGLYKNDTTPFEQYVYQGLTMAEGYYVISAYSDLENNSVLYILSGDGSWNRMIDLGFVAHVGGIAYDETRRILWCTGASGNVHALSWDNILTGGEPGEPVATFNAGVTNAVGNAVASFLTLDGNTLYVGSYCDGDFGTVRGFELDDLNNPTQVIELKIPDRIQSVAFRHTEDGTTLYMTQGYDMENAYLLKVSYSPNATDYTSIDERVLMPEGTEQLIAADEGLYIMFESSAPHYKDMVRTINDRFWLLSY